MEAEQVCAFLGFTQLKVLLGFPWSLVCSLDWNFLVLLCHLVAILLQAGVCSISS